MKRTVAERERTLGHLVQPIHFTDKAKRGQKWKDTKGHTAN